MQDEASLLRDAGGRPKEIVGFWTNITERKQAEEQAVRAREHEVEIGFKIQQMLGAFLSCLRQLNTKGGELKLCGMSKSVYQTFELVRMHRIFDIYSCKDEAVQAFQP